MPIAIGIKSSKFIVVVIALSILISLFYFQLGELKLHDWFTFFYFIFALQIPLAFLIYKIIAADTKKAFRFAIKVTKMIMLMGIFYLFVFAYILLSFIHIL